MPPRNISRHRVLVAALAALTGSLTAAAPAVAYLRDFQTVQAQSSLNSASAKTVISACPGGKVALSTGAVISGLPTFPFGGATTDLGLQRMRLSSDLGSGTQVSAVEADPVRQPWLLGVQNQCASVTNVPPGGAAGSYVKEVTVVRKVSAVSSTSPKDMSVSCGAGRQSIGGGFANGLGSGRVAVRRAMRIDGGFRVVTQETDPTGESWQMYVIALCANLTRPGGSYVTDLSVRAKTTSIDSSDHKATIVDCPAGQLAIGGGAEVVGSSGAAPPDVTLVASDPSSNQGVPTGWHGAAGEEDPTAASWGLRLQAVCARAVGPPVLSPD